MDGSNNRDGERKSVRCVGKILASFVMPGCKI